MTCADIESRNVASNSIEMALQQVNHDGGHSHKSEKDLCSPFCSCSCCGMHIITDIGTFNFNFPVLIKKNLTPVPHFIFILIPSFSGSVWQPPQINS
jgi:hypothetical protein